jgi:hypothetical protein
MSDMGQEKKSHTFLKVFLFSHLQLARETSLIAHYEKLLVSRYHSNEGRTEGRIQEDEHEDGFSLRAIKRAGLAGILFVFSRLSFCVGASLLIRSSWTMEEVQRDSTISSCVSTP